MTSLAAGVAAVSTFDRASAVVFGGLAAFLLAVAALIILRAWQARNALPASLGVISTGLAGALVYETAVLWTGSGPTISRITALQFQDHVWAWLATLTAIMLGVGALVAGFVWRPRHPWRQAWPLVAATALSVVGGGQLAHVAGWLP